MLSVFGGLRSDVEATQKGFFFFCFERCKRMEDCTFIRSDARLIVAGISCLCGPKFVSGRRECGDCLFVTTPRSRLLKEQMSTTQINVATEVFQKSFRQQERCSSGHHAHTQYSVNRGYDHSLALKCLTVTKTEGHLFEFDLLLFKLHIFFSICSHEGFLSKQET